QIRTALTDLPIMLTGGMRSRAVMDAALAGGAVDVVGVGRPMTHTPELPARLLDGSLATAPAVRIRSRFRLLDDALQSMWIKGQILLLAAGRDPDPKLGKWPALWRGFRHNFAGKIAPSAIQPRTLEASTSAA